MFYKLIERKRDAWLADRLCPVADLLKYILQRGMLRDAQIEAIKTYLYLKIACGNKNLAQLFIDGTFNTLTEAELDAMPLSVAARSCLQKNKAALALYEYASLRDDSGNMLSAKVVQAIKDTPESIDYAKVWRDAFYGVSYTDYLFSLPMGAGKTYLMAIFIYLDLYFAMNEPSNTAFAHNFIVFAPSGLKSSVVPSLKTIKNFDTSWIIPEPAASNLRKLLIFEVLDQSKTEKKSNKVKNPNVQKLALHQPFDDLFGLVAVTNAEKVILDRVQADKGGNINLYGDSADEKDRLANELRNLIGKIPQLAIYIDEVHHAVSDEIKLRAVVNKWAENGSFNSVVGFSGTPYLDKKEKLAVTDTLAIGTQEISNIVYYYALVNGIGNFLKKPEVKIAKNADSSEIVEAGVRLFLDRYKDKVYSNGCCAKLGIYCGRIEKLEEEIYPVVERVVRNYGLNPEEVVLKFHEGNKEYKAPERARLEFATLDNPISKIKIILLIQIGKEGWDCTSLTGVVLSQAGACPNNMVLQTSCRCLRQVDKHTQETALIYLNESNGDLLNKQLKKQHHIDITEFERGGLANNIILDRFDRTQYLHLPKVEFCQLNVRYETFTQDEDAHTAERIAMAAGDALAQEVYVTTQTDFSGRGVNDVVERYGYDKRPEHDEEYFVRYGRVTTFNNWLYAISKGSFGSVTMKMLRAYEKELRSLFSKITVKEGEVTRFSGRFNIETVNSNIRKAFYAVRDFVVKEEKLPQEARLLQVEHFTPKVMTNAVDVARFMPEQQLVHKIIEADKGVLALSEDKQKKIDLLESLGEHGLAEKVRQEYSNEPDARRLCSYHYLPYKTDSSFEQRFFDEVFKLKTVQQKKLEVYYNGDSDLTEFKIRCYEGGKGHWHYVGLYTPDFLIIERKENNIHKALIVETKGSLYAQDKNFLKRRAFVEKYFMPANNAEYGYKRFDYLYLEDSLSDNVRLERMATMVDSFFEEAD